MQTFLVDQRTAHLGLLQGTNSSSVGLMLRYTCAEVQMGVRKRPWDHGVLQKHEQQITKQRRWTDGA
jgi:hypothetical protein